MSEPARYTIEKVEDLLAIPDDKLEACLIDLATWIRLMAAALPLVEAGLIAVRFVWIDDDKHIARVHLIAPDGTLVSEHAVDLGPR